MASECPVGWSCRSALRTRVQEVEPPERCAGPAQLLGSVFLATQNLWLFFQRFASSPGTREVHAALWEWHRERKSLTDRVCKSDNITTCCFSPLDPRLLPFEVRGLPFAVQKSWSNLDCRRSKNSMFSSTLSFL